MRIAYFDCFNGVAGDMVVGALIDAGLPLGELTDALRSLPVEGYDIAAAKVKRHSLAATHFQVKLSAGVKQPHRHFSDIHGIIKGSDLPDSVKNRAVATFERLAVAEAEVHGTDVEKVHFHEVGAIDAIIDIVGTCWAIEKLGIEKIICSPIPVGSGTVRCEHGLMPVPAPATAHLLKDVPLARTDEPGELTTPTGAALMATLASEFSTVPPMTISDVGMGAGSREGETRPNVLRVLMGEDGDRPESDRIVALEANIDDATPETIGYVLQKLLKDGALDAYCLPIHMKKSRPAVLLCALARPEDVTKLESVIFQESTTFGIRRFPADRSKLERRIETVDVSGDQVSVKVGMLGGKIVTVAPEYDDCRLAAEHLGRPLRIVMDDARNAFFEQNR